MPETNLKQTNDALFTTLQLPCGAILKNRIVKSAMSDSLGDGTGHPAAAQENLYSVWANGGVAVSVVGEVQGSPDFAEKPGNLVLNEHSDQSRFSKLAEAGQCNGATLWLQLGHAGALAYAPTSRPMGPSALNLPGLTCEELTKTQIAELPTEFATTAGRAKRAGFGGVELHAAHGFLLSQFLSPLFNRRSDEYGGAIANRARLTLKVIEATRAAVGPDFPIALKLNASDQLHGGLSEADSLKVVGMLDTTSLDLIDVSGGTYFPGAKSASDSGGPGPYFLEFAKQARRVTSKPLMLTGGFKTRAQAESAVAEGHVDVVGLARVLALQPNLVHLWRNDQMPAPEFPRFAENPEGGITAWYTLRLTVIGEGRDLPAIDNLHDAIEFYENRDKVRTEIWTRHFGRNREGQANE